MGIRVNKCFPAGLEAFQDRLRPLLYVWWG